LSAIEWEDQSNDCVEYQCDNESGRKIVGNCLSKDGVSYVCVDGNKCVKSSKANEDGSNVTIDMNPTTSSLTDFMLSGPSAITLTLIPRSNMTLPVTFIPLRTGILHLPDIHIVGNDQSIFSPRMQIFVKSPPSSSS